MYDDGGAFDGSDGGMFGGGIEPLPQDITPSGKAIILKKSTWSDKDWLDLQFHILHKYFEFQVQ